MAKGAVAEAPITEIAVAENQVSLSFMFEGKEVVIVGDENGLELSEDLPIEVWLEAGRLLGGIGRKLYWYVGDWMNHGEKVYGELAAQGSDDMESRYDVARRITGLEPGTLSNIRSLCGRIARSRRREELQFWTHEPVGALDPEEQTVWLARAVEHAWTRNALRNAIAQEKAGGSSAGGNGSEPEPKKMSLCEQAMTAMRLAWNQAQTTSDGSALVPAEAWAQVGAALGEIEA